MLRDKSVRGKQWISTLLYISLVFALVASFLFAQLHLHSKDMDRYSTRSENTKLPEATSLASVLLNYKTFAADLGWIQMVVDYGDQIEVGHKNVNLLHNGNVISSLDPHFHHLYEWIPGAYFANNINPSLKDMARLTKLLQRGQRAFPTEGKLSYDTAVNYMDGNTLDTSDYRKLANANIATHYLKQAMSLPKTPEYTAPLLAHFENQKEKIIHKYINLPLNHPWAPWMNVSIKPFTYKPDPNQLAKFLLTNTDPEVLDSLRRQLLASKSKEDHKLLEQINSLSQTFESRYQDSWKNFLPAGIWSTLLER